MNTSNNELFEFMHRYREIDDHTVSSRDLLFCFDDDGTLILTPMTIRTFFNGR
jgi:hypothetical protein